MGFTDLSIDEKGSFAIFAVRMSIAPQIANIRAVSAMKTAAIMITVMRSLQRGSSLWIGESAGMY